MSKTNGNGRKPDNLEPTGERDDKGRFLPGHAGLGGRPPRIDIRAAAKKEAEKAGIDIEEALGRIMLTYIKAALDDDLKAAQFVVDRLSQTELKGIEINAIASAEANSTRKVEMDPEKRSALLHGLGKLLRERGYTE